jgi:secreted trypsin-like serine protease
MEQPDCDYEDCTNEIEDEKTFVSVSGGTVHHSEPQGDAGGGMFHPTCAIEYIEENYRD